MHLEGFEMDSITVVFWIFFEVFAILWNTCKQLLWYSDRQFSSKSNLKPVLTNKYCPLITLMYQP